MKLLIQWAVTSSALILIVLEARYVLRNKLSARWRYALWGIVLLRLLVPFQVELPAAAGDALPVLASNLAPETAQWEEPSIPVFPERSKPVAEFNLDIETTLEPGDILSYSDGVGCLRRDGETITWYRYILSPEQIVLALWLVGAGLAGAVMLASNLRFAHRLRRTRKTLEAADSPIPVYVAAGPSSPCLFGVLRPAVYVTAEAAAAPDTLRHVLAHELTHYRHRDHSWSLLRCLALALHWYNPLVWLAVALSKQDGELACDEGAVARLGEGERIPYGRTLVDMVAARSLRPGDLLACSTAMTGGKKSIQQRVARLVKHPETVKAALFAAVAVVVLAAVFVFVGRGAAAPAAGPFPGNLEQVSSIRYSPPLYSSTLYPAPITDEDLLAQAKECLSSFLPLTQEDPQPDLGTLIHTSTITLTSGSEETTYTLLHQQDRTYLFPGALWRDYLALSETEGDTAQLVSVGPAYLSPSGTNVILTLEQLAGRQNERAQTALTQTELGRGRFLAQLEAAQSIFVGNPPVSSQSPPGSISNPETLAQAKELLLSLTPIAEPEDGSWEDILSSLNSSQEPQPLTRATLEDLLFLSGHSIVLSLPSGQDCTYYLSPYQNLTLLLQWEADQEEPIRSLAYYSGQLLPQLEDLARQDEAQAQAALLGDLTQEQVDQINKAFEPFVELSSNVYGNNEISCFFTSNYDDPTQINLEEFLRYCPIGVSSSLGEEDTEEFLAVMEQDNSWSAPDRNYTSPLDLPVPVHRYPRAEVSALLQKYAGVTVEELDWSNCLYVAEYDAFYNFTSDAGPGFFPCAGGQITGDTVLLWSEPDENGDRCELTLRKSGERWLIQSHHTIYER